MRVVIAPDSFKGSLSASLVARAIATGVRKACPDCVIEEIPIADGGEGTLEAMVAARQGEYRTYTVRGPLGVPTAAQLGLLDDGKIGVIEMAQASGLLLIAPEERNPLLTSTFGTGELIGAALDLGCRELIITIGGSATVDGGLGMLAALGARFYDGEGQELEPVGGSLPQLARVDIADLDPRLRACRITIASDVTNPLCGPNGAAAVFGPQKGATPAMVEILDQGLRKLAQATQVATGMDVSNLPGGGAAGGLGAALMAYAGGVMRSGIDVVLDTIGIETRLAAADLVFTGEGRMDEQTAHGKAPVGLARRAQQYGCPVVALVGSLGPGYEAVLEHGISSVFPVLAAPTDLAYAMEHAAELIADTAFRVTYLFKLLRQEKGAVGGKIVSETCPGGCDRQANP